MKLLAVSLVLAAAAAQIGSLDAPPVKKQQWVSYTAEPQSVPAGRRAMLELRFHVDAGFHVNSHTPKSELLIPTRMELDAVPGVKPGPAEYPAGQPYSFAFDPGNKLDVYAGDFTIRLPVTADRGDHELHGTLKYQACDKAACYPPRTLPITVVFAAR